jgi:antitoxin component of MazEF toxin-antitoxin module
MEIEATTRRWGNSIVVVIPSDIVEKKKIRENEKVTFRVEKKLVRVRDIFGLLKGKITRPTQEIKDEMKRCWLSATDREREEKWKRMKNRKK